MQESYSMITACVKRSVFGPDRYISNVLTTFGGREPERDMDKFMRDRLELKQQSQYAKSRCPAFEGLLTLEPMPRNVVWLVPAALAVKTWLARLKRKGGNA